MSHFTRRAVHPVTGKVEDATWIDPGKSLVEWRVLFPDGYECGEDSVQIAPVADTTGGADA